MTNGGFWPKSTTTKMKKPSSGLARCGTCGLLDTCNTPQMPVFGDGEKGVLIVGEAPGKTEDEEGVPFVGQAGDRLRTHLNNIGVDLNTDCWVTNANICRPPDNETPNDKQIDACRPFLMKAVKELNPTAIILLGGNAIASFIGGVWKQRSGVGTWAGWKIPLRSHNMWVCPTYHPSWIMREDRPIADMWFEEHLKEAFDAAYCGRPYAEPPVSLESQVQVVFDPQEAAATLRKWRRLGGMIAFDYETNMLKPDSESAEIVSCSVCYEGRETIAYIWHGEAITATSELLRDGSIPKLGWNAKFEDRWTRAKLGHGVNGWAWDGMVNAHLLDNRPGITSIKFQSFVRLGIRLYNDNIDGYFQSEGSNLPNRIRDIEMTELLRYNGMDAILEYLVCCEQMEETGLTESIREDFANRYIKKHGGQGILSPDDVPELKAAERRVYDLLSDGEWHGADEIRMAAGKNGVEASEGLRRLRDLRPLIKPYGYRIEKERAKDGRLWQYRMTR